MASNTLVELRRKFNTVISAMINHITDYHNDATMSTLRLVLDQIISNTPDEPISFFLLHVYSNDAYRQNIIAMNDEFFMKEEYNGLKQEDVGKLFEFKNLWTQIDQDTKNFIKKSMHALVKISQQYVLSL